MYPFHIARRYLFARSGKSVVHVISWISLIGIAVASAALVVVLSVYNGIGEVTQGLYSVFDPALSIKPVRGKSFHTSDIASDTLRSLPGVAAVAEVAEENAWLTCHSGEAIVSLRGVDETYPMVSGLDTMIHHGEYLLRDSVCYYLLFGSELYYRLGLQHTTAAPVTVNIPRRTGRSMGLTPQDAFNTAYAYPAGTFYLQKDIDNRYAVCHIDMARSLLGYADDEVSSLSLALNGSRRLSAVRRDVEALLPEGQYQVLDRAQQQPLYYKIFRSERLGVILVLSLIVVIATLNLVASLTLLVIDKRRDIQTFRALGMPVRSIRRTFVLEGMLISWLGIIAGMAFGFVVCLLQQHFGIVKMGSGNFIVDAFPVAMRWQDFAITLTLVGAISSLAVLLTTVHALRRSGTAVSI
ncbi:MAG: ABC transporter permease [Bacteroidales bacterium]|nr:ABC transporter permease [Bacteroidales bacterium]